MFNEIFYPLLGNPMNRSEWPAVIDQDVNEKIQILCNTLTEIKGNLTNETILAGPMNSGEVIEIGQNYEKFG